MHSAGAGVDRGPGDLLVELARQRKRERLGALGRAHHVPHGVRIVLHHRDLVPERGSALADVGDEIQHERAQLLRTTTEARS